MTKVLLDTDKAAVIEAISGATVTDAGTPASDDKVLIQATSDSDNLKYVNISDLPGGGVDVLSNVATDSIIGRTTAGSGDSEELTASEVRTLINVEDGATADQDLSGLAPKASPTFTGTVVLPDGQALVTPALGTPASGVLTNATGLPVAGLADGTDGELITWDASGNAATVAVGTADQVLTSNGAGAAPTFQDAAGGGAETNEITAAETWTVLTGLASDRIVQVAATVTGGTFKAVVDGVVKEIGDNSSNVYKVTSSLAVQAQSSAFNINRMEYSSKSFDVSSQEAGPQSLAFNSDGTSMFIVGFASNTVYQYTLSTGFDVSTASYASKSFDVSSQEAGPSSLAFNSDGTSMFIVGAASDAVYQYTLSTGFDVSTASYASKSFGVSSQETSPRSLAFNSDGTSVFIVGSASDAVYQYNLNAAINGLFTVI